jgi:surface antigen
MNKKNKLIVGGVIIGVSILILGASYLFRNNFEAVQTSLVKYYNGANYQCVAYVERYYQNMFGIKIQSVGNAMNLAKKASQYGLYFHENGGVVVPQVGDILVFGNKNKVGHVAIVTGVLKDGILIVEQNWHKAKITNNKGKALMAKYQNEKYTIADRYYDDKKKKNKFWIMGWVSRTKQNPGTFFNFRENDDSGWLLENNLKRVVSKNKNVWAMKVVGKDPRVLSPVFLDGLNIKKYNKFVFATKVDGNEKSTGGVLYLRDKNDKWSQQIPFEVNFSDGKYKTVTVDLKTLPNDFKITQLMLRLTNSGVRYGREVWEIDWARIGDRKTDIL